MITVLALVGLLGPTLQSVDEVEQMDELTSVVNTVNAFLQSSPDIAPEASKFDAIYRAVESDDYATLFVFQRYVDDTGEETELAVGFLEENSVDSKAELDPSSDFANAAGTLYRVVLSASPVTPEDSQNPIGRNDTTGVYSLASSNPAAYPEGYFAIELRIYVEEARPSFDPDKLPPYGSSDDFDLSELMKIDPMFTYNTAVVR
jgi:hypothetical protein